MTYVYQGAFNPYVHEEFRINNFIYNFTNASSVFNNDTLGHFVPEGTLNHVIEKPGENPIIHRVPASIMPPVLIMRFQELVLTPVEEIGTYGIYHIMSDPNSAEIYLNLSLEMDISGKVVKISVDQKDVLVHPDYNPAFEYERIERALFYTYYDLGSGSIDQTVVPCMLFMDAGNRYSVLYIVRKDDGNFFLGYKDAQWNSTYTNPWYKDIQLVYAVQCTDELDEVHCNLRYAVPDMKSVVEQFRSTHSTYHSINDIRTLSVSR